MSESASFHALRRGASYLSKRLLMRLVRPFAPLLSDHYLRNFPVVGRVSIHLPNGQRVCFETEGYDYTTASLYWRGIDGYEAGTVKLFLRLLRRTDVFIDIGANTGLFALLAAAENPARAVYAFEPVPRIFQTLKRNIRLNGFKDCHASCLAVGDYDGDIRMFVPPGRIPSGATTNPGTPTQRSSPEMITARQTRLDTYLEVRGVPRVDLIKIDTETTEPKVLRGGLATIEKSRPFVICEVLPGKTGEELQSIMEHLDYAYYWISGAGLIKKEAIVGDSIHMNYLFAPKEKALDEATAGCPED